MNEKLKIVLGWALLLVTPFLFSAFSENHEPIRLAKILAVVVGGGLVAGILLWKHVNYALGCVVGYLFLNSVFTGFGSSQIQVLISVSASVLCALIFLRASDKLLINSLKALAWAGFIQALWGLLQHARLDPFFVYTVVHDAFIPVGSFGQQTVLGPFLVCAVAAILWLGIKYFFMLIPIIAAIFFIDSSMTYLSLGVVIAVYTIYKLGIVRGCAFLAVLSIAAYAFFVWEDNWIGQLLQDNCRFHLWNNTWNLMLHSFSMKQKLFGLGGGSYAAVFHLFEEKTLVGTCGYFLQAHNEYIQLPFEFGIIGAFLVLWVLLDIILGISKTRKGVKFAFIAILLSLLANAIGHFTFRLQPHGLIALISFIVIVGGGNPLIDLIKHTPSTWRDTIGRYRFIHAGRFSYGSCSKLWRHFRHNDS